jgi:HAD superfamily hydrolase (TIGR01490 family)
MRKVAFFDIDGTVFRSSLLVEVVEMCIQEGIFPTSASEAYMNEYTAWINRDGTYDAYINAIVITFLKHIKGIHYGVFADIGKRVVEQHRRRTYRYTRDLIQDLKEKEYYIVAISQSPKTILDGFCASYGFDKVYGSIYEIGPRDLFTGTIQTLDFITDKAQVVQRVFEKEGYSYERSIGVGDTDSDIPMLESVETPICFNPNRILYEYAQKKKWPIVVERKDVVYTI